MSALLTGYAMAATRQHTAASRQLATLRRHRGVVPVTVMVVAAAVGVLFALTYLPMPTMWWVMFAAVIPAGLWWKFEAQCRTQRRAVLRADAIRDAADRAMNAAQ